MKPTLLHHVVLGIALISLSPRSSAAIHPKPLPAFSSGSRILFQGDSITDGNRGRSADPNHILGHGYAFIIASQFGAAFPERQLTFLNRGVSGNKVPDLAARWEKDTLALKPDLLSILIGVNDASTKLPVDQYEAGYDALLASARAANPKLRLVLCDPFILPVGKLKNEWEAAQADMALRRAAVARLANKYGAAVAHFQRAFDEACRRAPADYWIWDGVHPTYSGHQIMAEEWLRAVRDAWPRR